MLLLFYLFQESRPRGPFDQSRGPRGPFDQSRGPRGPNKF